MNDNLKKWIDGLSIAWCGVILTGTYMGIKFPDWCFIAAGLICFHDAIRYLRKTS
ncbi:hypothetical protein JC221_183 [Yersinia phage JC221]|nr:hypothetical protein JC221_183 [Yersinia phage JC221]